MEGMAGKEVEVDISGALREPAFCNGGNEKFRFCVV